MNLNKFLLLLGAGCGMALVPLIGNAQTVLYSDDFDTGSDDVSNWNINLGLGNNAATFGYDYSALGIPSAPNAGGTTIGVKLEANYATGTGVNAQGTGVSISPVGQSFSGNYKVTFDMWQNYVGPGAATGSGTTQLTGAGIGASGTVAENSGTTTTSVWFGQTGDGGNGLSTKDYRVYSSAASGPGTGYATNSGVYAAAPGTTTADNANAQYSAFGGVAEPAGEALASTNQTGTTPIGAPGFAWHQASITKLGNFVTYKIDSTKIATVDLSTVTLGGSNIEFIQSDVNSGASTDPNARTFTFGLIDDVKVVSVPAPSFSIIGVTNGTVSFQWASLSNLSYQVQYKTNLTDATWSNLGAPIAAVGSTTSTNDSPGDAHRFYRLLVTP